LVLIRIWRARVWLTMTGAPSSASAAPVVQPQQVETVGAAQELGHRARLHFLQRLGEQRRQAVSRRAAHASALQASGASAERCGDLAEIGSAPSTGERLLGADAAPLDLLRARVLRHRHQDVRQVVLVRATRLHLLLGLEKLLDLAS
jgi:hypothetical protein